MATDRPGAREIKQKAPETILIWLTVPNIEELEKRMQSRKGQTPDDITERIALAARELKKEQETPFFDHHVLNDNFKRAVDEVMGIVKAEIGT